jgi:hypothetical protein
MGCIHSKSEMDSMLKRLDKLEAHMNLLDDDIYYIEKRLKRRKKNIIKMRETLTDENYISDATIDSNTSSPKTKSGMNRSS